LRARSIHHVDARARSPYSSNVSTTRL
jgi:hypothetical protein